MYSTPIVYIFFNRPKQTQITFARIREIQPQTLYLIADGPRAGRDDDAKNCAECRRIVEGLIDWPCRVVRDFAPQNMGCGGRLSSGLTSAFAQLGEAIVLEDDILPHPDFFTFCATMLALHRDNPQIHAVNGFNPLGQYTPRKGPAVPTLFNSIWGWASWQRSWRDYRFDLSEWKDPAVQTELRQNTGNDLIFQHYAHGFQKTAVRELDSWDYQWTFAMLRHHRYALASTVNFIENIGFSGDATHTHNPEAWLLGLRSHPAIATNKSRDTRAPDRIHDRLYSEVIMSGSPRKIAFARLAARWTLLGRLLAR